MPSMFVPWVGVPQNAENAEKGYRCSKNAEKRFLDWDPMPSMFTPWVGVPQNAENVGKGYLCSNNAEK